MAPNSPLILVVDDTPATLRLLSEHLGSQLFQVAIANDGEEAMTRCRVIRPDLVLMDIMMSGLDGITATKRMANDPELSSVPVILMTSLHDTESKLEGFNAGAVDYLTKPLNLPEVTARVKTHLRLRDLQRVLVLKNDELQAEIGKRATAEGLLLEANSLLEQRVLARTAELTEANKLLSREIDERRKIETTLRANEERLRLLYDENPAIYFSLTSKGVILSVNPHGASHFGYRHADLVGKSIHALTHEHDRDLLGQKIQACIDHPGATISWELRRLTVDGQTLVVREIARAIPQQQGTHLILVVSEDITPRQKLEAQLRQAQKMDAFGQLAGGVAHDFNNILTVILGQAQSVDFPDVNDADRASALREIAQAAHRASKLTRQLLVFSRRHDMLRMQTDLNVIVTDLAKMLGRFLGAKVELSYQLSSANLPIEGDASLLEQVLLNLCINARDAMPSGGRLVLRTERKMFSVSEAEPYIKASKDCEYALVCVQDSGTGIPADLLSRIFEPFFSTKEEGQGTGLGLTTSQSIVQQHGGWIQVSSSPGNGSVFSVVLPLSNAGLALVKVPEKAASPRGSARVLLVEDEPGVRKSTAQILRRNGYTVIEACDGRQALELWEEQSSGIDLLLTDIVMPGELDGHALASRLLSFKPELRVAFMSGYNPSMILRGKDDGSAALLLPKPFTVSQLLQFIRDALAVEQS